MWIRERLENPPQISDLSTWRKIVIVVAIAFALTTAFVGFDKHMEIQATAPDHPVPAQGRVFPVDVNHGYIRYVTWEEKQSFLLWAGQSGSWAGAAMMIVLFILLTAPRQPDRKRVRPFIDFRRSRN